MKRKNLINILCDVEALGPCPGLYSMTEFAAIALLRPEEHFPVRFYGKFTSLDAGSRFYEVEFYNSDHIRPRVSTVTPEELQIISDHETVIKGFRNWLEAFNSRVQMISDNNGFDFQFINYYLWKYTDGNPFGHTSTNLGSLYKGIERTMFKSFKHLRHTAHTHHPIDDCLGNAEAVSEIAKLYDVKGLL